MLEQEILISIGEWVVHSQYGVGQIEKTEVMPLHGKRTECFRVKVKDGAFWIPAKTTENPRIRPIASEEIIPKEIKILQRKPSNLEKKQEILDQKNQ